ncbi:MAG: hypothetical protein IJA49_03930 [Oscillospiraceae bacterium]|nr:hypothetical protein [Oscillospiraceae bacterium]
MKRILSALLCMVLLLNMSVSVFAASELDVDDAMVYDDGETQVLLYEDDVGNIELVQYTRGELVQKDIIYCDDPDVIHRYVYDDGYARNVAYDTISVYDYGTLTFEPCNVQRNIQPRKLEKSGTIYYRTPDDTQANGYYEYGIRCLCYSSVYGSTTYTINSFLGKVVDLVALLVGALNVPKAIISAFITELLKGLGITVVSGMIKNEVSATVSCVRTDYTWNLTSTKDSTHKRTVYGTGYYITEAHSAVQGRTYSEGYVPSQWGTTYISTWFHETMFSYYAWELVRWG